MLYWLAEIVALPETIFKLESETCQSNVLAPDWATTPSRTTIYALVEPASTVFWAVNVTFPVVVPTAVSPNLLLEEIESL